MRDTGNVEQDVVGPRLEDGVHLRGDLVLGADDGLRRELLEVDAAAGLLGGSLRVLTRVERKTFRLVDLMISL